MDSGKDTRKEVEMESAGMEPAEFLGIVFRSSSHMYWFVMTMIMLGGSVIVSAICVWMKDYTQPIAIWGALAAAFLVTSAAAVRETKWGAVNGPVWSADCIWYNALLAGLYFSAAMLWFIGYWLLRRRQSVSAR